MPDADVPSTWHDLVSARAQWRDAPADDEKLQTLLDVSKSDVLGYAPRVNVGGLTYPGFVDPSTGCTVQLGAGNVPANYRLAQITQARNRQNATKVDPSNGAIGDDSFTLRPFPLDWTIKSLIRPITGVLPV